MDTADWTLIGLIILSLIPSGLYSRRVLRAQDEKVQKYKLYAVRDQFVFLVASGRIRESNFLFRNYYKACNYFINETDAINFRSFVTAVDEGRRKGLDPAQQGKFREKLEKALREERDEEIMAAVHAFHAAMTDILLENSRFLRLMSREWLRKAVLRSLGLFGNLLILLKTSRQGRALGYYRDNATLLSATATC